MGKFYEQYLSYICDRFFCGGDFTADFSKK